MLEIYLFVSLSALLVMGNIAFKLVKRKKLQLTYNFAVLLLLSISALLMADSNSLYLNFISINPFSAFFMFVFALGLLLVHLLAYEHSHDYSDFALLGAFSLMGMYFVSFATSLITIFIGLELVAIPTTFIILLSRRESMEAATKFFIMASIAISLLSFAIVLVYGSANSLSLQPAQQSSLLTFAIILSIASLGFEASIFPFNLLLPDVYQGSASYVAAMLGGINEKVGFAALLQVFIVVFIASDFAFAAVAALSVFTMFYGNLVALMQDNLKRMMAYSSISQAGYILIGVAVRGAAGVGASLFQIFAHVFLFIGVMSIVAWMESKDRSEINDLIGLYRENRLCALTLSLFLLALVGVPLTTGFVGKFLLFLSAVNTGMAWLAILGIVNSVISVFYYTKVITAVYTNKAHTYRIHLDSHTTTVLLVCIAITLIFGIYPQPIIQIANSAAGYLFGVRII